VTILIVGLGAVGQRHARNLRAILGGDVDLIAYRVRGLRHVVTPALEILAGRTAEDEYQIRVFDNLELALREQPTAAFICNPSSMHVTTALTCVRAGCDVFIEKPLAGDGHGVSELLEEVARRGRIGMVGYQLRFHPCFMALEDWMARGAFGTLLGIRAVVGEYLPGWHPYEDYREMYASKAALGGGVVLSQIHEIDYLYALLGMPRRVFSIGGRLSDLDVDVEDTASTMLEFARDGRQVAVHLHQDYLQRPANRSCEVIGTDGRAVMDLASLTFTSHDSAGPPSRTQQWTGWNRNEAFLAEARHFLNCVATRAKPVVDLSDGFASLRVALAIKQSLVTGGIVDVAEPDTET